ncbi:MAG: glycosyltransferase [Candidatus Lindowbacteria bacterium]|nr:glycosyltransferase [Candidatus Lindowbacteria bacterium]
MKLSVIVSTYNAPKYLDLVLDGLTRQTDSDFECIVADDGSGQETEETVGKFIKKINLIHSWQEDDGFRLAASRNRALTTASGDVIAMLDGDCIPSPFYIEDIKEMMKRCVDRGWNCYLQGHRVILDDHVSSRIEDADGIFESRWLARNANHLSNIKNAIRFRFPTRPHEELRGIRGCSMIFRREALHKVNGFDESFEGWGHEDKDIVLRLQKAGVKRLDVRGRIVIYHLYHEEQDRSAEEENRELALSSRSMVAENGIRKLGVITRSQTPQQ